MSVQWTQTRTVGPIGRPVTVRQLKTALRLSHASTHHDEDLSGKIDAAVEVFEADTDRPCISQTFELYLDELPSDGIIPLKKRPVSSVTSVKYHDSDNVEQTMATSVYTLVSGRDQVRLDYDQAWPSHICKPNSITVTYVAGAAAENQDVPRSYQQAILCLAAAMWDDPADERTGSRWQTTYEALVARLKSSGDIG